MGSPYPRSRAPARLPTLASSTWTDFPGSRAQWVGTGSCSTTRGMAGLKAVRCPMAISSRVSDAPTTQPSSGRLHAYVCQLHAQSSSHVVPHPHNSPAAQHPADRTGTETLGCLFQTMVFPPSHGNHDSSYFSSPTCAGNLIVSFIGSL